MHFSVMMAMFSLTLSKTAATSLLQLFKFNWASLVAQMVKNPPAMPGFAPWVGKIPWRRKWQPIPVFWLGESHGQRTLADYSLWGRAVGHY